MKLSFLIAAFGKPKALRTCLSALIDQTEEEWEAVVCDNTIDDFVASENRKLCDMDERIYWLRASDFTFVDTPHIRHKRCLYTALEIGAARSSGTWLCFAGQDAYFAPVFAERMLLLADERKELEFIHCDTVLGGPSHGYFTLATAPRNCGIDLQSFIVKRNWFQGFPHKRENYELADGLFVESLVERGIKHGHLAQVLSVKN